MHLIIFKERIDFRLWNSTLVEDYPKVDMVKIGSNAKIVIPSNIVIQQENLKDDYAIVSIFFYIYNIYIFILGNCQTQDNQ